jgi:hypothetical protein
MNSKQINFFITIDDYEKISNFFIINSALFIRQPLITKEIVFEEKITEKAEGEFSKICISKRGYETEIDNKYIEKQGYYLINGWDSLIFEFSVGEHLKKENVLEKSRLYYIKGVYKGDQIISKDPEFTEWVDDIFKKFKKEFLIIGERKELFSKNALDMIEKKNGKLSTDATKIHFG